MRYFRSVLLAVTMLLAAVPGLASAIPPPTPTQTTPAMVEGAESSLAPEVEASLSNAARFQRGLGPRRPRELYNASRVLAPRTSNTPSTPYFAEVAYASDPNTVIGWLGARMAAAGAMALWTAIGDADLFYAPDNVPATDAVLTTYSGQYTGFFTVSRKDKSGSSTTFTSTYTATADSPIWDLSDFDSSGNYIAMRYALGATTYKMYLYANDPDVYVLYGGESAAAINAAFSLSMSEANEVLVTLARES